VNPFQYLIALQRYADALGANPTAWLPWTVLQCVGHGESMRTAVSITRPGGAVGRVGVRQESTIPNAQPTFYANITVAGGPAPVRAYMHELMADVLEGRIEPGLVFDRTTNIDGVPEGYRAMNERQAIKVMIEF
jgi:threonine dehydrogenase-like Zn-dependent dehydrogenase